MKQLNYKNLANSMQKCIQNNQIIKLRSLIQKYSEPDIADALSLLEKIDILKIIRSLDSESAAEIFTHLNTDIKEYIITSFSNVEILDILNEIFTDEIIEILDEMPANITKKILHSADKETRDDINKILKYDPQTAGSIMSVDFIELRNYWDISKALEYIRDKQKYTEDISSFYVINDKRKILGIIRLENLIFNSVDKKIEEIMDKTIISVNTEDDQEDVALKFKKYDLNEMPVVNKQNKLIGVITIDDVIDVIDEEATEDIEKLAGILPTEKSYFEISTYNMVKVRTFWLLFLMISATLSQLVISWFMKIYHVDKSSATDVNQITTIVTTMLVPVIPLISGTSGNAGSQASTMVVRNISLGYIKAKDWYRVMYKEFKAGCFIALVLIFANFIRMYIIDIITLHNFALDKDSWFIIIILSLSLFVTILLSKIIGGILPIISKQLKIDPAVIAAPLLTTLVDALSTMIFFAISLIFFSQMIT